MQYDASDDKDFGSELINNSSGASVDDPTFSVLEAELEAKDDVETHHIEDKKEIEQDTSFSDVEYNKYSQVNNGSDSEYESHRYTRSRKAPFTSQNKSVKSNQSSDTTSKRTIRNESSSSEGEGPSDENYQGQEEDDHQEEDDDDYDDDDEEDDYGQQQSYKRTYKRSHKAKREEEDEQIRSICKLVCAICSKQFSTFNDLTRHYQTKHQTKGFVTCCERKIKTRSRLVEHIECHNNPNAYQ